MKRFTNKISESERKELYRYMLEGDYVDDAKADDLFVKADDYEREQSYEDEIRSAPARLAPYDVESCSFKDAGFDSSDATKIADADLNIKYPVRVFAPEGAGRGEVESAFRSYCEDKFGVCLDGLEIEDIDWTERTDLSESADPDTRRFVVDSCDWKIDLQAFRDSVPDGPYCDSREEDETDQLAQEQVTLSYDKFRFPVLVEVPDGGDIEQKIVDRLNEMNSAHGLVTAYDPDYYEVTAMEPDMSTLREDEPDDGFLIDEKFNDFYEWEPDDEPTQYSVYCRSVDDGEPDDFCEWRKTVYAYSPREAGELAGREFEAEHGVGCGLDGFECREVDTGRNVTAEARRAFENAARVRLDESAGAETLREFVDAAESASGDEWNAFAKAHGIDDFSDAFAGVGKIEITGRQVDVDDWDMYEVDAEEIAHRHYDDILEKFIELAERRADEGGGQTPYEDAKKLILDDLVDWFVDSVDELGWGDEFADDDHQTWRASYHTGGYYPDV